MKAFYYEDYYYLIPEPFADLEDFRAQVDPEQPVSLIWLQEEHCMAPYFVSEQTCRAERRIQRPENMFPAEVWILTQKEYDKRLRAVVEKKLSGLSALRWECLGSDRPSRGNFIGRHLLRARVGCG